MKKAKINYLENIGSLIGELQNSKIKGKVIACVIDSSIYRERIISNLEKMFSLKVIKAEDSTQIIDTLKKNNFSETDFLIWNIPKYSIYNIDDILNILNNFKKLIDEIQIPMIVFYNHFLSKYINNKLELLQKIDVFYEFNEAKTDLTYQALELLSIFFTFKDKEDLFREKIITKNLLENEKNDERKSKNLSKMGLIYYYLGDLDKALEHHEFAIEIDLKMDDKIGISNHYGNIGLIYQIKGNNDKALEYYTKALKLYEELKQKISYFNQLVNIGNAYLIKGEFADGLEYHDTALYYCKELSEIEYMAKKIQNTGNVYLRQGDPANAIKHYKTSLQLYESESSYAGLAKHLGNIGIIYKSKGELNTALGYFSRALKLNEDGENMVGIGVQLGNMGSIYKMEGELDKALDYYKLALRFFNESGVKIGVGQTLINIGDVYYLKGENKQASKYYIEGKDHSIGNYLSELIIGRLNNLNC